MPAFSGKRLDAISEAIRTLYGRSITFKKVQLAHKDLIELFVQPKHRDQVLEARKLFGLSTESRYFSTNIAGSDDHGVALRVTMNVSEKHKGFLFPHYMGDGTYGEEAAEGETSALSKLRAWADWRADTARNWDLVAAVFRELSARCATPAEVRFFWPTIVPIVNFASQKPDPAGTNGKFLEGMRKLADDLGRFKAPPNIPKLPVPLKAACLATHAPVARSLLMPNPAKEPPKAGQVSLLLQSYVAQKLPWDTELTVPRLPAGIETSEGYLATEG